MAVFESHSCQGEKAVVVVMYNRLRTQCNEILLPGVCPQNSGKLKPASLSERASTSSIKKIYIRAFTARSYMVVIPHMDVPRESSARNTEFCGSAGAIRSATRCPFRIQNISCFSLSFLFFNRFIELNARSFK